MTSHSYWTPRHGHVFDGGLGKGRQNDLGIHQEDVEAMLSYLHIVRVPRYNLVKRGFHTI
jgi:hypothetical protein